MIFTVRYHYVKYKGREIDANLSRTATVRAETLKEAVRKIKKADREYVQIADNGVSFSEEIDKEESR